MCGLVSMSDNNQNSMRTPSVQRIHHLPCCSRIKVLGRFIGNNDCMIAHQRAG